MSGSAFVAVGIGAMLGAWLRWLLGVALNPLLPSLPLGTLVANLAGGFMIGVAVEYVAHDGALPLELRLFVITGFLGALTTFSTFSAEIVGLLARANYGWALILAAAHLAGSLIATIGGIFLVRWMSA